MAGYNTPRVWVTGELVTAAMMNQEIQFNIVALSPLHDYVDADETTASGAYTDLTTAGPSKTLITGTSATVIVSAYMFNDTGNAFCFASWEISGATTLAADDDWAAVCKLAAGETVSCAKAHRVTGLTAGSNTIKMKYRGTGTAHFQRRELIVIGA